MTEVLALLGVFVLGLVLGYAIRPRWDRARYVVDNAVEISRSEHYVAGGHPAPRGRLEDLRPPPKGPGIGARPTDREADA